jgi:hypothetical protein
MQAWPTLMAHPQSLALLLQQPGSTGNSDGTWDQPQPATGSMSWATLRAAQLLQACKTRCREAWTLSLQIDQSGESSSSMGQDAAAQLDSHRVWL